MSASSFRSTMPPKPPTRIPVKPNLVRKKPIDSPTAKAAPWVPLKPNTARTPPSSRTVPPPPPPPWPQQTTLPRYAAWPAHMVAGFCALVWLRDHYLDHQKVVGSSMAPTLSPLAHEQGKMDRVVMRPYMERSARNPRASQDGKAENKWGVQRGDVVTFWKPHKPEELSVKRVVAVEGDVVYPVRGYALDASLRESRLQGMLDGLPDEDPDAVGENEMGRVVVPYGHIWVEGDNWRQSFDSNDFGPVSKGLVLGKVVWIWRGLLGFERVGDGRDEREGKMRSRIEEGRSEIPAAFLE